MIFSESISRRIISRFSNSPSIWLRGMMLIGTPEASAVRQRCIYCWQISTEYQELVANAVQTASSSKDNSMLPSGFFTQFFKSRIFSNGCCISRTGYAWAQTFVACWKEIFSKRSRWNFSVLLIHYDLLSPYFSTFEITSSNSPKNPRITFMY